MDVEMGRGERALVVVIVVGFLVAALSQWVRGDGLEVDDQTAVHTVGAVVHILAGVVDGEWNHRQPGGGVQCFQAGPPPPGAHPDSIYFHPRRDAWIAWVGVGPPVAWATCDDLDPIGWVVWWQTPGYIALRRWPESYRYSVTFAYLRADSTWDQTWDWRLRQE